MIAHETFMHLGVPEQFPDASHLSFLVVFLLSSQGVPMGAYVVLGSGHFPVEGIQVPCIRHWILGDGSLTHTTPSHLGVPAHVPL